MGSKEQTKKTTYGVNLIEDNGNKWAMKYFKPAALKKVQ